MIQFNTAAIKKPPLGGLMRSLQRQPEGRRASVSRTALDYALQRLAEKREALKCRTALAVPQRREEKLRASASRTAGKIVSCCGIWKSSELRSREQLRQKWA